MAKTPAPVPPAPAPVPAPTPAPVPAPVPAAPPPPAAKPGDPGAAGPVTGMFTPPPAHAPQETTQPLHPDVIAAQAAKAAQNEKSLQPLQYALDKAVASATGAQAHARTLGDHTVVTAPPAAAPTAPSGSAGAPHQPAASDTDTPTRGIPKPISDPGKQITGGWGADGGFEPQYYALDGTELLALIKHLWASLQTDLDRDLRFGIACCYPQVAAKVTIEITGAHAAASVNDIAFTLESRVYQLTGEKVDDASTPADALRVDAGLARPFKHTITTPTGKFIVDRDAPGLQGPIDTDPEATPGTEATHG